MLEEIKNIKTGNKELKSFGYTIGVILIIVASFLFYYDNHLYQTIASIAALLIVFGLVLPLLLKPVYLIWMIFAVIIGWIMTRLILSILFYIILTPIALITRLLGEDFLYMKKSDSNSYWNERDSYFEQNQNYEKQF